MVYLGIPKLGCTNLFFIWQQFLETAWKRKNLGWGGGMTHPYIPLDLPMILHHEVITKWQICINLFPFPLRIYSSNFVYAALFLGGCETCLLAFVSSLLPVLSVSRQRWHICLSVVFFFVIFTKFLMREIQLLTWLTILVTQTLTYVLYTYLYLVSIFNSVILSSGCMDLCLGKLGCKKPFVSFRN